MDKSQSIKLSIPHGDTITNIVCKHHISLSDKVIKINNQHLQKIISDGLIPLMKEDPLFKDLYKNINYAGSFFKGTKVGKPDEFDLDLGIKLPLNYKTLKVESDHEDHGFVKVEVGADSKLPLWEKHSKILDKWLDDQGYLDQDQFRRWMERVMTKTYDQFKKLNNDYELVVSDKTYILKRFKKSGPAFTIYVKLKNESPDNRQMDVDLVPCLEFDNLELSGYRVMPELMQKILIVAKPVSNRVECNRLWRLSYYNQEKQILQQGEAGKMKPVIRLLKKFRDQQTWKKLASYYIETLCLHEMYANKLNESFHRAPVTCLFIHMLNKLRDAFAFKQLPFFWHAEHNLLEKFEDIEAENIKNRLTKILNEIEKNIKEDKYIIAKFLLNAIELDRLKELVKKESERGPRTDEVDSPIPLTVQARVDRACVDLSAILIEREELSPVQLDQLREICTKFV